ncbi:unnamed protein product [Arctogadus glacialis]
MADFSSLLSAILGELPHDKGVLKVKGQLTYACQQPWVFPGTIRGNILFGKELDPAKYEKVLRACALKRVEEENTCTPYNWGRYGRGKTRPMNCQTTASCRIQLKGDQVRGGKHSHALQLGSIREREDPANELPNNGELQDPAKRRSGEAIRCGDNRRRGSQELPSKRAPSAQPLTFIGSAPNSDRPVLQH